MPFSKERLIMSTNGSVIIGLIKWRILLGILCGPYALLMIRLFIMFKSSHVLVGLCVD